MGGAYSKFGVDVPFDPQLSLVTSPVYSPFVLATIRLLLGFYYLVFFIFWFSWESVHSPVDVHQSVHLQSPPHSPLTHSTLRFFSYFTHLSAIGLCAYFWAAGVQTAAYARWEKYPLRYWPQSFQLLHLWLSATAVTFRMFACRTLWLSRKTSTLSLAFIVTIAYWALLASSTSFSTPFNGTIKFFSPSVWLITLTSPLYSLGEHFSPHLELRLRPIRDSVDLPWSDPLALSPRLHLHHRFIHCSGLHHPRNPELLSSVSPFLLPCFTSSVC